MRKEDHQISKKQIILLAFVGPIVLLALLYAGGFVAQFLTNYQEWQAAGGEFGTSPALPDGGFFVCLASVFHFPQGLYGIGIVVAALGLLIVMVMRMGYSENGNYDRDRNIVYSNKGTYGTAGFMTKKDLKGVVDIVPNIRKHHGIILGELDGDVLCIPEKTRFNGNLAVYGASGSKKTRSFCMNMILQSAARRHSLIICDPKSELYEKSSEYLRDQGYVVKVFNLVTPTSSDSWNCLAEIEGKELMAQLFCDVIIKNTGGGKADHFWDNAEMNLLKALVLYVDRESKKEDKHLGEVYKLLTMSSEKELDAIFDVLPASHPAKAPYSIFKQSGDKVRGGVIIGLGSRLQVFQNSDIREITGHDEIDLELPGKQPCAYYCITSDQDSTFDFLSSLFLSFVFIKLVRYADENCPGGALPVPVHVLGEELCACGVIPDLSRKISVIRSRNISMSCVFQNLAGLQNRYPLNQWQEILGNCDVTLFLGCTDALTADFISQRTGEASIAVTSKARQLGTWRISNYTPEYRETSGVGKRRLMTMDEVLRMDIDKALVILRGKNVLEVDKYDYSKHPESKKLRPGKASAHVPEWRAALEQRQAPSSKPASSKKESAARKAPAPGAPSEAAAKAAQRPSLTEGPRKEAKAAPEQIARERRVHPEEKAAPGKPVREVASFRVIPPQKDTSAATPKETPDPPAAKSPAEKVPAATTGEKLPQAAGKITPEKPEREAVPAKENPPKRESVAASSGKAPATGQQAKPSAPQRAPRPTAPMPGENAALPKEAGKAALPPKGPAAVTTSKIPAAEKQAKPSAPQRAPCEKPVQPKEASAAAPTSAKPATPPKPPRQKAPKQAEKAAPGQIARETAPAVELPKRSAASEKSVTAAAQPAQQQEDPTSKNSLLLRPKKSKEEYYAQKKKHTQGNGDS